MTSAQVRLVVIRLQATVVTAIVKVRQASKLDELPLEPLGTLAGLTVRVLAMAVA